MLDKFSRSKPPFRPFGKYTREERDNLYRIVSYVFDFLMKVPGASKPVSDELMDHWFCDDMNYIDPSRPGDNRGKRKFWEALEEVRTSFAKLDFSLHQMYPNGNQVTLDWSYKGYQNSYYPGLKDATGAIAAVGMTKVTFHENKILELWQIFQLDEDGAVDGRPRRFSGNHGAALIEPLSPRERDVFHWICEGKTNEEIAIILSISTRTVEKHCQNIFKKLGVENRRAAMLQGYLAG